MAIENLDFRIKAAIDAGESARTLGDLKTSLRDLRDLAAQTGPENVEQFNKITLAAGNVNDKIKDVRESVQALSGPPMERLGNSFSRLRSSIFELDLDKFKQSLVGIKDSFIALGSQALSPFKNLGVAISGLVTGTTTLTGAMRALGGAIAATGIGALVVAVGLLVTYWKDLAGAGGLVGNAFNAVSDAIGAAVGKLEDFLNKVGLINTVVKKEQESVAALNQEALSSLNQNYVETNKLLEISYQTEKAKRESNRKQVFATEEETFRMKELYKIEDIKAEQEYLREKSRIYLAYIDKIKKAEKDRQADLIIQEDDILVKYQRGELSLQEYLEQTRKVTEERNKNKDVVLQIAKEQNLATSRFFDLETDLDDLKQESANRDRKNAEEEAKAGARKKQEILEKAEAQRRLISELNLRQIQDANTKELETLDEKYEQEKFQYRNNAVALIELEKIYQIEREKILKSQRKKEEEEDNAVAQAKADALKAATEAEKEAQDKIQSYREFESEMIKQYTVERIDLDNMYSQIVIENASLTTEQVIAEIQKRVEAQANANKIEKQQKLDLTNDFIRTAQYGVQAIDGFNQFLYTMDENRRITAAENEKQTEEERLKLEEQIAQKAFERNKSLSIVNAAINTAAGVTAVLASPTNKLDPSGVLQSLQIAFVVAAGAAQIAAIAAQNFDASSYTSRSTGSTPTVPEQTIQTGQFASFTDFKPGQLQEQRVYVVESDITGVQRKVRVIENRSRF